MSDQTPLYVPSWLQMPEHPEVLEPTIWEQNFSRAESGELLVDGTPVEQLRERFGTPQYVFSESVFRRRARTFRVAFEQAFEAVGAPVSIYYAGKSFLCSAVAHWADDEGLYLDTASGGELALAIRAGVPAHKVALHGNNKSDAEIRRALEYGVGRIVADSVPEVQQIARIAESMGIIAPVLLRLTPGVHASTHDFIATAHEDQKFGQSLVSGTAELSGLDSQTLTSLGIGQEDSYATVAAVLAHQSQHLDFRGVHCHIGSQIFEADGFIAAATKVLEYMQYLNQRLGINLAELDLGGGYGIGYTCSDTPREAEHIAQELADSIAQTCERLSMPIPHMSFEPGRSISGPSGMTLYTVGTVKDVAVEDENGQTRVRRYVSVDGGMSDNARPVLYEADYTAVLANRAPTGEQVLSRVVGKHCESGDVVVRYVYLPQDIRAGDMLAVPATGAYCYALSSNYNYLTRPPVVSTATDREPSVIVRGQSEDEMLSYDVEITQ
ncbi:diaminopimelate decarboxylase family protein [Rothia sp. CCM 9419]|uniref:diaminopimelate decarboxylase family protein n=1 Tax=Rothia sp. CCM 9419 TaxID=3402662 RepID=UPI003AD9A0A2